VYLKYGVFTVVKIHVAVFCIMKLCWSLYQGLGGSTFFCLPIRNSRSYRRNPRVPAINPLNAELNPICHLLALLGAHHILHVSRLRVNAQPTNTINLLCHDLEDILWK
jgi:hypothetical protein